MPSEKAPRRRDFGRDLLPRPLRAGEQVASEVGQLHSAAGAMEQAVSERHLEFLDATAQHGMRDLQLSRGLAEAGGLRDLDEVVELPQVDP